jgi:hypothetical protein
LANILWGFEMNEEQKAIVEEINELQRKASKLGLESVSFIGDDGLDLRSSCSVCDDESISFLIYTIVPCIISGRRRILSLLNLLLGDTPSGSDHQMNESVENLVLGDQEYGRAVLLRLRTALRKLPSS